ncbi:EF-hand domain-containing protein [Catenovulum sp. SM1970]|uniref:EF-hand domain-containing protein n=1 Tax=Marinifaba aquimaris TaxID=2741323 RepID=UPI0015724A52|nr:EF-hand domain-containing protein [Marinifaba aquimaris]NTS75798.1 EF-hand domain-containing protein [Marinifaba aquimaris]
MKNTRINKVTQCLVLGAAMSALAVSTVAQAKGHKKRGSQDPTAYFERLDTNLSESLTLDELTVNVATKAQSRLEKLDSDENGSLSLNEYLASRRAQTDLSSYAADIVACVQAEKDATGDTNIQVPDSSKFASPEDKFDAIDTDDSTELSIEEITAALTNHATEKFDAMDTDDSNEVSLGEFSSAAEVKKATKPVIKACIDSLVDDSEPV